MRIFLDTNVLASAFGTRGLCGDVLREVLTSHNLIVCGPLFKELKSALSKKFKIPENIVSETIGFLKQDNIVSKIGKIPQIPIKDKDDLIILSCAINGKADLFVTGDKELLELKKLEKTIILSPRAFWEKIKKI